MSNLYYRNLPGIEKESQATAIEINSRKSIQTFLNYYHNYRTHEEKKVIKIKLIYKDWDDFFELQNFEEAEKKFIKRRKSDLDKVPQELKELRQLKKFQIEGRGLYEIEIIDDKIEDNQVISDLVSEKKVSFSPNIRYDKFENLDYVSKRYEIVIMKISYDDKGNPKKGLNVYYKPNVRQINLIINTLMKLKDTPGRHNRELLRLFEDRNKTRFNQIVRAKLQESDWLFLTDNTRAGNQEQREFVQIAMETPDFAILDGPPGSGKTTTILELIYQLISRDQKVLLVGSTHVAVDNVIEKLMDPLFPAKDKINKLFLPIRVGDPDRHPISDFASDYTLTNIWNAKKVEQIKSLRAISNKTNSQIEWEHLLSSKGESKSIQNTILRTNSLTCGTTVGVTTHSLIVESNISNKNKPLFNYLILDEASKTTFQEFLIPGLYAEKFIIIGDVNQLSPFVDENGLSLNIGDISL
ncbi:MAG: AAA domain-containing protein, partial [Candidatus Heimdallarchaeota archaeon]|nr:AAA domain-containing protein [Candidatus Heimdallarchaeota archaeon]